MENTEADLNDKTAINPADGIILPSGPPLTPQFSLVTTPPTISQAGQFTTAQLQALALTQNNTSNTPINVAVTAAMGANTAQQHQQPIGIQQMQPMDSVISPPSTQSTHQTAQILQWNPSNQVQTQNTTQQWVISQPALNTDPTQNQAPQMLNPFAQLVNNQPQSGAPEGSPLFPPKIVENPTGTGIVSSQQSSSVSTLSSLQNVLPGTTRVIDNTNLAAYIAALSNQNLAHGPVQLGNLLALNNGMFLAANTPQGATGLTQGQPPVPVTKELATAAPNSIAPPAPPTPGTRAYLLLAVNQTRKQHVIKKDVERMKHLKTMKSKLVGKVFQPLNYRYASNYRTLESLPGWFSGSNKEKLRQWGLRGSERFRQTLLLEIEAEMIKVKGRRDVLFHDEQNGSAVFGLVSEARNDLRI